MKRYCAIACISGMFVSVARVQAADVKPGRDLWVTGTGSSHDFSTGAIPAGFFGPGSEPFTGIMTLKPNPLISFEGRAVGRTDTIVNRTAMADLTPGPSASIPIEVIALSLSSSAPIQVGFPGPDQLWRADVVESPTQASNGSMVITQTNAAGGTYTASMCVFARFTFTRVDGAGGPLVFDAPSCVNISTPNPVPWTHAPRNASAPDTGPVILGYTGDASNLVGSPWTNDFYANTIAEHTGPHPQVAQVGIPTVSEWGVAALTLLMLTAATIVMRGRTAPT